MNARSARLPKALFMSLATFVKISSVSNLSDARYCAGMGVDQLGFCLDAHADHAVSPELYMEIRNWVSGVEFVGEFKDLAVNEIAKIQKDLPLDFIEISNLEQIASVRSLGKSLIFDLELTTDSDIEKLPSTLSYLDEWVEYVVLNCKNPYLSERINRSASVYRGRLKLIRGFDVTVDTLMEVDGYAGIQLRGAKEQQLGLKDYDELMDVLELLAID